MSTFTFSEPTEEVYFSIQTKIFDSKWIDFGLPVHNTYDSPHEAHEVMTKLESKGMMPMRIVRRHVTEQVAIYEGESKF